MTASITHACVIILLAVLAKPAQEERVITVKKAKNVTVPELRFRTETADAIHRMIPATRTPVREKRLLVQHWMKPSIVVVAPLHHALQERNVKT